MKATLDRVRFGPWALVTGASSGIGVEFARRIAASGINVVLVARREAVLNEVAQHIAKDFGVQCRAFAMDLSDESFLSRLVFGAKDLDIGLVVSNAEEDRRTSMEGFDFQGFFSELPAKTAPFAKTRF